MEKLKVVIADDMQVIAENNKRIATLFDNIEVVGIANNGQEEYDMIMELKPDLVITDNQMPLMNGVDVHSQCPIPSETSKAFFKVKLRILYRVIRCGRLLLSCFLMLLFPPFSYLQKVRAFRHHYYDMESIANRICHVTDFVHPKFS